MLKKKIEKKFFSRIFLSMRKTSEALIIFINCLNNVESIPQNFCKSGSVVAEL